MDLRMMIVTPLLGSVCVGLESQASDVTAAPTLASSSHTALVCNQINTCLPWDFHSKNLFHLSFLLHLNLNGKCQWVMGRYQDGVLMNMKRQL